MAGLPKQQRTPIRGSDTTFGCRGTGAHIGTAGDLVRSPCQYVDRLAWAVVPSAIREPDDYPGHRGDARNPGGAEPDRQERTFGQFRLGQRARFFDLSSPQRFRNGSR